MRTNTVLDETIATGRIRAGWLSFVGLIYCLSATAIADDSKNPNQRVSDGILVSVSEPSLAISVSEPFSYIGRHPIRIGDRAAGERFVYVDRDEALIRRLVIVQFEGFLPGVDDEYRYNLDGRPVVAGYPFRSNGYAFDLADSIVSNPTSESASTKTFLDEAGLIFPAEWMMWRSLTVADEARKKEIIIFYIEDVASTGLTIADLYHNDSATEEWISIQKQLEIRANNSFQLAEVDEHAKPVSSTWSSVPSIVMKDY